MYHHSQLVFALRFLVHRKYLIIYTSHREVTKHNKKYIDEDDRKCISIVFWGHDQ